VVPVDQKQTMAIDLLIG